MTHYYDYSGSSSFPFPPVPYEPYGPEIPQSRINKPLTAGERRQLISEKAYLRAKRRGFAPGHELSDWLAAEQEVNRICGLIEPAPRWK